MLPWGPAMTSLPPRQRLQLAGLCACTTHLRLVRTCPRWHRHLCPQRHHRHWRPGRLFDGQRGAHRRPRLRRRHVPQAGLPAAGAQAQP